ncbi:MAG TPA: NAD(P)H-hydrate epimerase, partial [Pyrinomonadaceae bacterium]|nr:NAD(P)H-hydrate epimerase [Pyrinomonadaceae bacterium]
MREIDRLTVEDYSTPSLLLMEAAASACLLAINTHFSGNLEGKKARILCGKGNNGGDGAALARALARAGIPTDVVLFGRVEETKGDARTNFEIVRSIASFEAGSQVLSPPLNFIECDSVSSWEQIASPRQNYHLIVDALFGTGLSRPLEGIYLQVVQHLNLLRSARERASGARPLIVSLDIPSGLNADSAEPIGDVVRADLTVTFTAPKPANVLPPASHFCGKLNVANIGSPLALIESTETKLFLTEDEDAQEWLRQTRYEPDSHKNSHGHVLVVGGSRGYTGAAALCGDAAIRSGAGLVTIATPASAQSAVAASAMSEVITTALAETDRGSVSDEAVDHAIGLASKATVLAIGPGLTAADDRTRRFVNSVVARRATPVIIDADGLNCLAPWPNEIAGNQEYPIVITPHPGEMLRLIGAS